MSQRKSNKSRRQASVDFPRYPPVSAGHPAVQQVQLDAQVSDYESDNQGYTSDYPTHHPPAERTNDELNLSVLQRHDQNIVTILSIAPFAVIYDFSPLPEPTWSKSGVEGSLFICQLTPGIYGEDRYVAIVLNRRGLDNFEAELREGENAGVEIAGEFVIVSYKQAHEQKINGIFIFSDGSGTSTEKTRELNADLVKQLAVQAGLSRKAAEAAAAQATARHTDGHMKEAESTVENVPMSAAMNKQLSLRELFNQQRAEDAAWSVRVHSPHEEQQQGHFASYDGGNDIYQATQPAPPQQDILGDLFRRAGFGLR